MDTDTPSSLEPHRFFFYYCFTCDLPLLGHQGKYSSSLFLGVVSTRPSPTFFVRHPPASWHGCWQQLLVIYIERSSRLSILTLMAFFLSISKGRIPFQRAWFMTKPATSPGTAGKKVTNLSACPTSHNPPFTCYYMGHPTCYFLCWGGLLAFPWFCFLGAFCWSWDLRACFLETLHHLVSWPNRSHLLRFGSVLSGGNSHLAGQSIALWPSYLQVQYTSPYRLGFGSKNPYFMNHYFLLGLVSQFFGRTFSFSTTGAFFSLIWLPHSWFLNRNPPLLIFFDTVFGQIYGRCGGLD